MIPVPVIGRFAPSPTGDLHFGSLVSAVGSYLEAKSAGGKWLLRIEDIDPPREIAGSATRIISDLERLGMLPDEPVLYQSSRLDAYQQAINQLLEKGIAYQCACSRKDLPDSGIYPGTCRNGIADGKKPRSIRLNVESSGFDYSFRDRLQGLVTHTNQSPGGDFVIRRADGLYAYQLAVVVDDHKQGVTQVVRGADLLDSTAWQICLQQAMGFTTPDYMHLPVALSADGKKLGKRFQTDPVSNLDPAGVITQALRFLGHNPPTGKSLTALWDWALNNWDSDHIPRRKSILPSETLYQ
jgi:glutamyl-Q tRNA(Asp) synthetase